MDAEGRRIQDITAQIEQWWASPRFENVERPYKAKDVAPLRSTIHVDYPSNVQSQKMWKLLKEAQANNAFHMTYGALDPVQVVNLSKYLKTVYVSGW
jgi:isocitrate lyase